jgi:D-alanyl-D-alanine dipeptidase
VSERYLARITRAAEEADRAGLDGLLVTPSADLVYLSGYSPPPLERLTCLLIRPGRDPILLVPELERPRAAVSPVGERIEVVGWLDGEEPYQHIASMLDDRGTFGASDQMWATHLLALQEALPRVRFVPTAAVLSALRAVKDTDELELLSRAARGADEAFRRLRDSRLEGLREEEIAVLLASLLRECGHDDVSFTIVASGPNGASPHHEPSDRTIRAGDPIVLDFGGRVGGYCSDLSRTVCVGEPPEGFDEVYELVREAQEAAVQAVTPGTTAGDVDRAARDVIESAGYGEVFFHRTGHGIGLEEHEAPWIAPGNDEELRPGMCFSIEPGIYLGERFGVRIEDIVVVTKDGANRLNRASRELAIVA